MSRADSEIAAEILRYLKSNPDASDTSEGIAKWWLLDKYPAAEVAEALDGLVARGQIESVTGKDAQRVYSAAGRGRSRKKGPRL